MSTQDYSHLIKKVDLTKVKPYGDIMDDGVVQLSFTLPVPAGPEGREAAVQLTQKMGFDEVKVATMEYIGEGFSFYVMYGKSRHTVDYSKVKVVKIESKTHTMYENNAIIKEKLGKKVVVLGACTGYDAHTVGIDAIINMKGYAGDYGLERYEQMDARNLGAQVLNEDLLRKAVEMGADAILVSKVVTQHNIHIKDLTDLIEKANKMGLRDRFVFVAGGPRITHQMALECGFDAGFGVGTKPSEVASYIVDELVKRKAKKK